VGILGLGITIPSQNAKTNQRLNTHSDGWLVGFDFSEVEVLDEV
jgi:hypothetical protein